MKKVYRFPVTQLEDVEVARELVRRWHWKRWFETKRRYHLDLALAIERKRRERSVNV